MKHLVIHRHCIRDDLRNLKLDENEIIQHYKALEVICNLFKSIGNEQIIVYDIGLPEDVIKYVDNNDKVMLYGAYKEECLKKAKKALENIGINAEYHPEGCIGFEN